MASRRIIFMGTPEISSIYLQSLIDSDQNIIAVLSDYSNDSIRVAIALCSSTSSEIIEKLANDEYDDVKDAVAYRELPD